MIRAFSDKLVESEQQIKVQLSCNPKLPTYEYLAALAGKTVGLKLEHTVMLGSYQGEYLFVFTKGDSAYTSTTSYGSCSGCDTLEAIGINYDYDEEKAKPRPEQVRDLYILTLDIVRNLKRVAGYGYEEEDES